MTQIWTPSSPCGAACLTGDDSPTVSLPRRVWRMGATAAVLVGTVVVAPLLVVLRGSARTCLVRLILRAVLAACGVRLAMRGTLDPAEGRGALVASNHISWLDLVGVNAVVPMRAVAKKEIASWPVLGKLVAYGGSVFLDRERISTLPRTVSVLADTLRSGALVTITPEGTTWCGRGSGRFRPALFQAAIDAGVPVRPVALRYRVEGRYATTQPAFIGSESLLKSVRRTIRLRGLVLEVLVCPDIAPGRAKDRRELAALTQASVEAALGMASAAPRPGHARRRSRTGPRLTPAKVEPPDATIAFLGKD